MIVREGYIELKRIKTLHTNENGRLILRTQLQIDLPPNLKRALKELAARQDQTLRAVVLLGLKEKYPELIPYINSALEEVKKF